VDPCAIENLSAKKSGNLLHIVGAHFGKVHGGEVVHHHDPRCVLRRGNDIVRPPYKVDIAGPPLDRRPGTTSPQRSKRTRNHWTSMGAHPGREFVEHWPSPAARDGKRGNLESGTREAMKVGACHATDASSVSDE
jgi:hypothetical protein